jgi:carboxylesterase type B
MFEIDATAEDQAFSGVMMDIWTQFAKTGNPTVPGVLEWPAYTADGHETAIIGRQIGMADGIRLRQSELITEAFNKRRE